METGITRQWAEGGKRGVEAEASRSRPEEQVARSSAKRQRQHALRGIGGGAVGLGTWGRCQCSQRFFASSTRVQWLFDSMPARLCELDAVDLARVASTCVACSRLAWPAHMASRPTRCLSVTVRGAGLLVKCVQLGRTTSERLLGTRIGAASVAGAVAAGRPENRSRLAQAGLADVLGRSLGAPDDAEARAAFAALRRLAGDVGACCRLTAAVTTPDVELDRLAVTRILFEVGAPAACGRAIEEGGSTTETKCEALRLMAALCSDFADLTDYDRARRPEATSEDYCRATREAFPSRLFAEAFTARLIKTLLATARQETVPDRERRLALLALSAVAGHTHAAELGPESLATLGSAETIDMCARFLPWGDDADDEKRARSEDSFDLLLSLLVTAVPRDGGDALARHRAALIQRTEGAVEALVDHVRTGRCRRFNDDDAFLTVANVAVCLLADIFQVNPMSCVEPLIDEALVDTPKALETLAAAIPDLLKTLDDPPHCFFGLDSRQRRDDKRRARDAYWAAGDSCPGGECVNLLRVLARHGYSREVRVAGAVPILEDMDRFCLAHPKATRPHDSPGAPSADRRAPSYTWNSTEVRLLLVDLFADFLAAPLANHIIYMPNLAHHVTTFHAASHFDLYPVPAPALASAASQTAS